MSIKRLQGKKAVVTGGTRGIGRAIAELFTSHGASVIIIGTNQERGEEVVSFLSKHKVLDEQNFTFRKVDVSNLSQVQEFGSEVIKELDAIDILVNCAGITRDKLLMKMKEDDWDVVIDTNLKSVYNMSNTFLRSMMKRRYGKIINVSSVVGGVIGNPGQTNYAASKAGMVGMTKSLAKEVGSRNITINCIAPGFIETEMTDVLKDEQKAQLLKQIPMGRLGTVDEIANVALFLASDESKYVTGQVLTVDGGMTA